MNEACWRGYKQIGMKKKGGRTVPNCVKEHYRSFAEWLNENYPEEGDSKYSSLTFNIKRRKLNVPELIKRGAIFVTYAHDEDGWEADPDNQNHLSDWSHSLISLYNVELGKKNGGWTAEAPEYIKPKSYSHAERSINSSAPNLGNNQLVYDGKYNQILWSIEKLKIPENIAFMESNHDY